LVFINYNGYPTSRTSSPLIPTRIKSSRSRPPRRLANLKELAALQEKVVNRMLDGSVEGDDRPKGPHLTVVK
jgi:hypothetical protein